MTIEKKLAGQQHNEAESKADIISPESVSELDGISLSQEKDRGTITQKVRNLFEKAIKDYPGGFIPRKEAPKLIGYLYSVGYLANCDSLGIGVENSFRIGRQRCYFIDAFGDWVISKIEED